MTLIPGTNDRILPEIFRRIIWFISSAEIDWDSVPEHYSRLVYPSSHPEKDATLCLCTSPRTFTLLSTLGTPECASKLECSVSCRTRL